MKAYPEHNQMGFSTAYKSPLAPFLLHAYLSIHFIAQFTGQMTHLQGELTRIMKGERREEGIDERNLPSRVILDTLNDYSRLIPNCLHAEIDLRSIEISRVVCLGECVLGGATRRFYRDATSMTEQDFERLERAFQGDLCPSSKKAVIGSGRAVQEGKTGLVPLSGTSQDTCLISQPVISASFVSRTSASYNH